MPLLVSTFVLVATLGYPCLPQATENREADDFHGKTGAQLEQTSPLPGTPPILQVGDIYAADRPGQLSPVVRNDPQRIYVPIGESNSVRTLLLLGSLRKEYQVCDGTS
jgi:hypothetical protein